MIGAVAERVLQIVEHAEAGAHDGVAKGGEARAPGEADAGLREEFGVIGGEEIVADVRRGVDEAVGEGVVGGAAVGFVPAVRIFVAEAEREREVAANSDDVFGVEGGEERSPVEWRG